MKLKLLVLLAISAGSIANASVIRCQGMEGKSLTARISVTANSARILSAKISSPSGRTEMYQALRIGGMVGTEHVSEILLQDSRGNVVFTKWDGPGYCEITPD